MDADPLTGTTREEPRQRVLRLGCGSVSVEDLLAVVLPHHGEEPAELAAARLLARFDGLLGIAGMDAASLRRQGLSPTAAARLSASIEIGRRLAQAVRRERPQLSTPEAVAAIIGPSMAGLVNEELWCLAIDSKSRLIGEPHVISKGDVDGTESGPRPFFRAALTAGAVSAIAVHNHPGGDPAPSGADRAATVRLVTGGRAVDVPLVDHVVIGQGCTFVSIRRQYPEYFR